MVLVSAGLDHRTCTGLVSQCSLFLICFLIFPLLFSYSIVAYYGSLFIAASETNMDVILNCVALCFIFELDDYAYTFFTQSWTQKVIENMPPVTREKDEKLFLCEICCGPCCIVLVIIIISYATYGGICVGQNPTWLPLQGNLTNVTGS